MARDVLPRLARAREPQHGALAEGLRWAPVGSHGVLNKLAVNLNLVSLHLLEGQSLCRGQGGLRFQRHARTWAGEMCRRDWKTNQFTMGLQVGVVREPLRQYEKIQAEER